MAASISTVAYCPGRRRSRCLNISSNANQTVESSFQKNEPDVNGSGKSRGLRGWLDRRYQLTPLLSSCVTRKSPWGRTRWVGITWAGSPCFFRCPGRHRRAPVDVLPTGRSDGLREHSLSDDQGPVRLVDPFGPQLERASDDHFAGAPHVQHHDAESLPPAARIDVGFRLPLVSAHARLRFSGYLLPWNKLAYFATTVGTNIVKSVPLVRQLAVAGVARRAGCHHQHAVSLLRCARGDPAPGVCRSDRAAPALDSTPGHGAAGRRQSRAARDEVFSPALRCATCCCGWLV